MKRKAIFNQILFFSIFIGILSLQAGCTYKQSANPKDKPYRVLVVFSYVKECEWTEEQYQGVLGCLKEQGVKAEVDSFHLDADILVEFQENDTLNWLFRQYENNPPDLIISCDDQATYAIQATEHPLTYKVPIVFCGVDYVNYQIMEKRKNITGFTTQPDYMQCYELAKQLFGCVSALSVIAEPTYLGRQGVTHLRKQLEKLPNLRNITELKIIEQFDVYENDTLLTRPASTPSPLDINILWFNRMDGRRMKWLLKEQKNMVFLMPRWSALYSGIPRMKNVPMLMVNDEGFGDGRLGGYMTNSYDQTYQATETGLRIMRGEISPDTVPVTHSKTMPKFDWRQLDNWGISVDKLPKDSIIINMPFTVKYRNYLWIGGTFLGTFIILLILVLDQLYRRERLYKKRILSALIKEQNELQITMESISEGVISLDGQAVIVSINEAALKWLQLDGAKDRYIGQSLHLLFDIRLINNPDYLNYLFSKVYQTNGSYVFDPSTYLVMTSGLSFPISGSMAVIHSENSQRGIIITFRNIINEMTQKEFMALTTTTGDVFVWKYNHTERLFIYDQAFFRFMQWPENETGEFFVGDTFPSLHPEDHEKWLKSIQIIAAGEKHHCTAQFRLQTGNGSYTWWEYRIVPEPNQAPGEITAFFGLCLNIDYLKTKEKELEDIRDKALEADRQKSLFLANMSHEIRTPLNAIVGFSSLLLEPEELTADDKQEFIGIINENCRLLLNLVNDILDISRIESGITFKHEPCDLNPIMTDLLEKYKEITDEPIMLSADLPESSVTVFSDQFRIRQILSNLLNNAIKFTEKGIITIGYRIDDINNTICFFVKDTGRGIPQKEHSKIFERFYKSDNFTQGGGLGLPICHEIVQRMKGTITVDSEPGKGTCFYITLPNGLENTAIYDQTNRKETAL